MSEDTKSRGDLMNADAIVREKPISKPTIWRQLKLGSFPEPVRVGRKCYWLRSDVENYFVPRSRVAS